jgi:hypothetical protein
LLAGNTLSFNDLQVTALDSMGKPLGPIPIYNPMPSELAYRIEEYLGTWLRTQGYATSISELGVLIASF